MKLWAGKLLELIGLVVVLFGFLFGIQYSLIKFELSSAAVGGAIFCLGWLLEKK